LGAENKILGDNMKKHFFLLGFVFIILLFGCASQQAQGGAQNQPSLKPSCTLQASVSPEESGRVLGDGKYDCGSLVRLIAQPVAGWNFAKWQIKAGGCQFAGDSAEAVVTLSPSSGKTCDIEAIFAKPQEKNLSNPRVNASDIKVTQAPAAKSAIANCPRITPEVECGASVAAEAAANGGIFTGADGCPRKCRTAAKCANNTVIEVACSAQATVQQWSDGGCNYVCIGSQGGNQANSTSYFLINGKENPDPVPSGSRTVRISWKSAGSVCYARGNGGPTGMGAFWGALGQIPGSGNTTMQAVSPDGMPFATESACNCEAMEIGIECQDFTKLILVPIGGTESPQPEPSPSPPASVDLKVNGEDNPASIPYESTFTVSWASTNAAYCEPAGAYVLLPDGRDWTDLGHLPASGSMTLIAKHKNYGYVSPLQLDIQCSGATDEVNVTVTPP